MGARAAIKVREAQLADLPALNALEADSFPSDQLSPRQMRYLLVRAKARVLVATDNDRVLAYAALLLPAHPRPARLYSLAVQADVQGRGIAGRLLTRLLQIANQNGYLRIRLEVRASAERTQALYRRFGFETISHVPDYYEDGEDALRMENRRIR